MSLSRLLDVTGSRLLLLFTIIFSLFSPSVAQAQSEGMGYHPDDPMFKLIWGIAFVCALIALIQAYIFFKKMKAADEGRKEVKAAEKGRKEVIAAEEGCGGRPRRK